MSYMKHIQNHEHYENNLEVHLYIFFLQHAIDTIWHMIFSENFSIIIQMKMKISLNDDTRF